MIISCPRCGNSNLRRIYILRDMTSQRNCLDCENKWLPSEDPNVVIEKGSYHKHQQIMQRTALIIQERFPNAFFCERHVGSFLTLNGNRIQIGLPGQGDAYAMIPCMANNIFFQIHIELEFKSGKSKLSKDQINWKNEITRKGGLYVIVRKPEYVIEEILKNYAAIVL